LLAKGQPYDTGAAGRPDDLRGRRIDTLQSRYGNRFLLEPAPDEKLPHAGMPAEDAMRLVGQEFLRDGPPMRNLTTFVTTWMEPQAETLKVKGRLDQSHRERVKMNTGY
jgi:glutamate/tyrosine decarboxylase-like PLP-dependent enzyme